VADVDVAAVDHHLHAVRPSTLIAVRQVTDAPANAGRRHRRLALRSNLQWGQPGQGQQFQLLTPSESAHGDTVTQGGNRSKGSEGFKSSEGFCSIGAKALS
jgi:hypothetical protein